MTTPIHLTTRLSDDRGETRPGALTVVGLLIAGGLIVVGSAAPAIGQGFGDAFSFLTLDTSNAVAVAPAAPAADNTTAVAQVASATVYTAETASTLISRVKSAEETARARDGRYASGEALATGGLLTAEEGNVPTGARVLIGADGSCYVVLVHGPDTTRFYTTSKVSGTLSVTGAVSADTGWCLNPQ